MALTPMAGSSMIPARSSAAGIRSNSTEATPISSTRPASQTPANMEELLKAAQPLGRKAPNSDFASWEMTQAVRPDGSSAPAAPSTAPSRVVGAGTRTTSQIPVDLKPAAGVGPIGGPAIWDQPQIPPVAPRSSAPNPARPILDEELMLAAQILDDEDYAAYLNERRRGGSPL